MTPTNTEALAALLQSAVKAYPQMSEDEPGGYCTAEDQLMDQAAAELRLLSAERDALRAERDDLKRALAFTARLVQDWQQSAIAIGAERDALRAALVRARGDINWMLNTGQFLNPEVFDYLDAAMKGTQ